MRRSYLHILSTFIVCIATLALFADDSDRGVAAGGRLVRSPLAPPDILCFADTARGRPFTKDPSVVRFHDAYFMYVSLPPRADGREPRGWSAGVLRSDDLIQWRKVAEIRPAADYEAKGLAAPDAMVYKGKVHLFYQTYGNGRRDAICHAISDDGVHFTRDPSNPIFRPSGEWNCGRAIDAETVIWKDRILLYWATRDPDMNIQMQGVAAAPLDSEWARDDWKQMCDEPILRPELPWETRCVEAASVCKRDGRLFMFYAGGYNNDPQQIGVAVSEDGLKWTRLEDEPLVSNGAEGEWNSSESGHPGVFVDRDGSTYLFYQGNADEGRSWYIACKRIGWKDGRPVVLGNL